MTCFRCRHCAELIEWFAPPGAKRQAVGRGYGWWFHPDRVDLDEPGLTCSIDLDDDLETDATPVVRIVEVVCTDDHCWVPGTPVVNSGGESNGQVLSENMCPVCGHRVGNTTYYEPVPS